MLPSVVLSGAIIVVVVATAVRSVIVLMSAVIACLLILHPLGVMVFLARWRFVNPNGPASECFLRSYGWDVVSAQ
jgi:hypothetical protein